MVITRTTRNRLTGKTVRGFESHRLRQKVQQPLGCWTFLISSSEFYGYVHHLNRGRGWGILGNRNHVYQEGKTMQTAAQLQQLLTRIDRRSYPA